VKKTFENNWRQKTIETLEKKNFGNPNEAPTNMVKRCLELCKIPLEQFCVEDLRLMIGQDFSLRYLIPLAIEHLDVDIFVEGDYYPGDLLKNVLSVDKSFWLENETLWKQINNLIENKRLELAMNKISTSSFDTAFDR
jgi:hypothetical protein